MGGLPPLLGLVEAVDCIEGPAAVHFAAAMSVVGSFAGLKPAATYRPGERGRPECAHTVGSRGRNCRQEGLFGHRKPAR